MVEGRVESNKPCSACGASPCRCDAQEAGTVDLDGMTRFATVSEDLLRAMRDEPPSPTPSSSSSPSGAAAATPSAGTSHGVRAASGRSSAPEAGSSGDDATKEPTAIAASPFDDSSIPSDAWFLQATTGSFRLDELLGGGAADALVLGDPTDVTGSIELELISEDGEPVVRQVHIGGDVDRNLGPDAILEPSGLAVDATALSPFERFVLQRVDGRRSTRDIQDEMRLSESDLRIALALLLDKRLLRPRDPSSSPAPSSPAPSPAPSSPVSSPPLLPRSMTLPPAPSPPTPFGLRAPRSVSSSSVSSSSVSAMAPATAPPEPRVEEVTVTTAKDARPVGLSATDIVDLAPPSSSPPPPPSLPPTQPAPPLPAPPPASLPRASSIAAPPGVLPLPGTQWVNDASKPLLTTALAPPPPTTTSAPVEVPRPAPLRAVPRTVTRTATRGGNLIVDNATDRAASLFEQAVREVKNGASDKALGLVQQAFALAPDEPVYQHALSSWSQFVATHKTPEDQRALAQAIRAEDSGDLARAVALLRQATQLNPANATAWNRLGLLLARQKDTAGAAAALGRAVELSPDDAGILSNFTKVAGAAEKSGGLDLGLRTLWKRIVR